MGIEAVLLSVWLWFAWVVVVARCCATIRDRSDAAWYAAHARYGAGDDDEVTAPLAWLGRAWVGAGAPVCVLVRA